MIASIANLLPEAPSARDDAVDVVCRMLGAGFLGEDDAGIRQPGRELLATATARCRKSAMTSSRPRRGRSSPGRQG